MAESFRLHVVTPTGEVLDRQVVELTAPGLRGQFGVLPRHARYMTALGVGELRYRDVEGNADSLAVAGGFAEITFDAVNVLAQTAEVAEEIDVARAEAALRRAQERLEKADVAELPRATMAMERSMIRLQIAKARGVQAARAGIRTTEAPIPGERPEDD